MKVPAIGSAAILAVCVLPAISHLANGHSSVASRSPSPSDDNKKPASLAHFSWTPGLACTLGDGYYQGDPQRIPGKAVVGEIAAQSTDTSDRLEARFTRTAAQAMDSRGVDLSVEASYLAVKGKFSEQFSSVASSDQRDQSLVVTYEKTYGVDALDAKSLTDHAKMLMARTDDFQAAFGDSWISRASKKAGFTLLYKMTKFNSALARERFNRGELRGKLVSGSAGVSASISSYVKQASEFGAWTVEVHRYGFPEDVSLDPVIVAAQDGNPDVLIKAIASQLNGLTRDDARYTEFWLSDFIAVPGSDISINHTPVPRSYLDRAMEQYLSVAADLGILKSILLHEDARYLLLTEDLKGQMTRSFEDLGVQQEQIKKAIGDFVTKGIETNVPFEEALERVPLPIVPPVGPFMAVRHSEKLGSEMGLLTADLSWEPPYAIDTNGPRPSVSVWVQYDQHPTLNGSDVVGQHEHELTYDRDASGKLYWKGRLSIKFNFVQLGNVYCRVNDVFGNSRVVLLQDTNYKWEADKKAMAY